VQKNKLPKEVVDKWPEVLDEVDVNVIPIEYIKQVEVTFDDDNIWLIDIDPEKVDEEAAYALEEELESLFADYEDVITSVNFVLDIDRVKTDITKRTKRFLKKKK